MMSDDNRYWTSRETGATRQNNKANSTGAMNDRQYWRLVEPLPEPQTTDTGATNKQQLEIALEPQDKQRRQILELREQQPLAEQAGHKRGQRIHWSHKRQILEPQATATATGATTGGRDETNDRRYRYYWSHERQTRNDRYRSDRYWQHVQQQILEP